MPRQQPRPTWVTAAAHRILPAAGLEDQRCGRGNVMNRCTRCRETELSDRRPGPADLDTAVVASILPKPTESSHYAGEERLGTSPIPRRWAAAAGAPGLSAATHGPEFSGRAAVPPRASGELREQHLGGERGRRSEPAGGGYALNNEVTVTFRARAGGSHRRRDRRRPPLADEPGR